MQVSYCIRAKISPTSNIKIKNKLDLKVYIKGIPDIKLIPDDIMEDFAEFLECKIEEKT